MARLAERLVAPVLLTYSAHGLLAPDHPCLVAGSPHVPEVGALWDEADAVVAVGTDLDAMMTQAFKQPQPPHLIAINVDPADASKNYLPDVLIESDAAEGADALAARIPERGGFDALARRMGELNRSVRAQLADTDPEALGFLEAVERVVPDDGVLVCDMCIPGYWLGGFHRTPAPRKLTYPLGWGTLGCAFPQALGAALAGAGPVVSVSGDGGFLFACGELATIAQERIPLTAVIVDDGGYGMLRFDQDVHGDPHEGVDLQTPDFVDAGALVRGARGRGERAGRALRGRARPPPAPRRAERARREGGAATAAQRLAPLVSQMIQRERRDELLEQAAEASRMGLRTRRQRIEAGARPILHSAVAAALAWLVATEVVGHEQPFFAPISAVITLGLTVGQRRRRAIELAIGVAVGIGIADALVAAIGTGTLQIGVVVALAMAAATLVGGGSLIATQAGASAVLVATLQPPEGGVDFGRALDALVGGGVALVVSSLLLPVHPTRLLTESVAPVLERLAAALDGIATALTTREPEDADAALLAIARADGAHDQLVQTLEAAGEAVRLSPQRRGALGALDRYAVAAGELQRVIENVRALARGTTRAINLGDSVPPEAVQAVEELAVCARALQEYLDGGAPEPAREAAVRAAQLANAVLEATGNLSAVHIVGQIRLAAVDLLRATALERDAAQEAVRSARLTSGDP